MINNTEATAIQVSIGFFTNFAILFPYSSVNFLNIESLPSSLLSAESCCPRYDPKTGIMINE